MAESVNESSLCQGLVLPGLVRVRRWPRGEAWWAVVASRSGPGSDLSEEPIFRMRVGHAGLESFLCVLPDPLGSAGRGCSRVDDEPTINGVGDLAFQ